MTERLALEPALSRPDLLADPVAKALAGFGGAEQVQVAPIDPDLADTAAFCEAYGVGLEQSANCVVLAGRREGVELFAACMVPATTRADVNGLARKHLGVRKLSFAPMDRAVESTAMQYGGITPIGLPAQWPILVDRAVVEAGHVVIGSGIRGSKLWLPGALLASLPGAVVLDGLGKVVGG
ncbi:MAG TPA: YbaK/EbsC family protein [Actinocrinis sp.]|nr:YbaK/EbsC family protein [Actinocrinis sp.]